MGVVVEHADTVLYFYCKVWGVYVVDIVCVMKPLSQMVEELNIEA